MGVDDIKMHATPRGEVLLIVGIEVLYLKPNEVIELSERLIAVAAEAANNERE